MTVILTEHKPEKIARFADKVLLLDDGRVVDFAAPAQVFSREDLAEYGVEAPIYTKVCRQLNLRREDSGLFPVTLEEAREVLKT